MIKQIYISWMSDVDGKCPTEAEVDNLRNALDNFRRKEYPRSRVISESAMWGDAISLNNKLFSVWQVIELEID